MIAARICGFALRMRSRVAVSIGMPRNSICAKAVTKAPLPSAPFNPRGEATMSSSVATNRREVAATSRPQ